MLEDVKQSGVMAIIEACNTYDKSKAKLSTHIFNKVKKAVYEEIYKQSYSYGMSSDFYRRNKNYVKTISIEKIISAITYNNKDIVSQEEMDIIRKIFTQQLNLKLPSKQREMIIDYYLDGMKYNELKKKYGIFVIKNIGKIDLSEIFSIIKKKLEF